MKIRTAVVASLLSVLALTAALVVPAGSAQPVAHAQSTGHAQIFLKLPDINGTATVKGFEKQIELSSLAFSVNRGGASAGGGAGRGKPVPTDFTLGKAVDTTSPVLFQTAATGKALPSAVITVVNGTPGAGPTARTVYRLSDVSINSVQTSTPAGGAPAEVVSLGFSKLEIEVSSANGKDPAVRAGYDFAKQVTF